MEKKGRLDSIKSISIHKKSPIIDRAFFIYLVDVIANYGLLNG